MKSHEPFQQELHLMHIVRRYGHVGGMERYVWELTIQLQKLGHRVTVVCERCYEEKPKGIVVHELGEIAPRPRWLSALRFDRRVKNWLATNPQNDAIIHSHERTSCHDIISFHGPLFATILEKPWWRLISLRVAMNLYLEKRELAVAKCIVPNSQLIKQQLTQYYPPFAHKLSAPVTPGIEPSPSFKPHIVPASGGVIGFVGKEWKRKGLALAVAAVEQLRRTRPNLLFIVKGPNPLDVQHLFSEWPNGSYFLKEWGNLVDYSEFDVLLHPAKSEPYGMVICEAMAAQVPVVISNECGARRDVKPESGVILPLDAPIDEWARTIDLQLSRTAPPPKFERSWREVAQEYENILYSIATKTPSYDFS